MSFDPLAKAMRSYRGDGSFAHVTPRGFSIVNTSEGFRRAEIIISPKCRVCQSPHRSLIDRQLLYARGYKAILRMLPPDAVEGEAPITAASIKNHWTNGHTTVRVRAAQVAAEERAKEIGLALEDTENAVVDFITLGRSMMDSYYQALQDGNTIPNGSEIVQVMRMFAQLEAISGGSLDASAYQSALQVVLDAVRTVVPDRFDEIMGRIRSSPVIQGIIAQREAIAATAS